MLRDLINGLVKSPQTSLAGIIAASMMVGVALYRGDDIPWEMVFLALGLVGVGVSARDNATSSERAGAK